MKPIFLIGFMGSGKSTVGRLVASAIELPFVDIDTLFAAKSGLPPHLYIPKFGIGAFRQWEKKILREVLSDSSAVIATGGGVILDRGNRHLMKREGVIFWLETPLPLLLSRLGDKNLRPLLPRPFSMSALEKLYQERLPCYRQCHYRVQNNFKTPKEVAKEIVEIYATG